MVWLVIIFCLSCILIVLGVYAAYQSTPQRISYIPIPRRAIPRIIDALDLRDNDTLFDLGCGDGRVLAAALGRHQGLTAYGVEINPPVAFLAKIRLYHHRERATIQRGDLFSTDLHAATKVFTYLNNHMMAQLEAKLSELPKGTRLVSCDFPLPNRKPDQVVKIGKDRQLAQKLYAYNL